MPFQPLESLDGTGLIWEPFEKQTAFIEAPDDIFEIFYGGAVGGGKSEVLLMLPIARGWYKYSDFRGILFRRTYQELLRSLIPRSMELFPHIGGKYNKSDYVWTFPSGAQFWFSYMENKEDAQKHDTAEYHYVAIDELTHHDKEPIDHIKTRIRTTNPNLPAIFRAASNPSHRGHVWVRERYIEPAPKGHKLIEEHIEDTITYRMFVPSKLSDNPHLSKRDPGYRARLMDLPPAQRRAYLDGDWWAVSGKVFVEFRPEKIEDEPDNAHHFCKPFEIPFYWPRVVGIDWGYSAATWIGWFAIDPDTKRVYLYREYCQKQQNISYWAREFRRLSSREIIAKVALDPSAWDKRGENTDSIAAQFQRYSGYTPTRASNSRIAGRMKIHEYLRFEKRPPKIPPKEPYDQWVYDRIRRLHGKGAANDYRESYNPDPPEDNIPLLQIFTHDPEGNPIVHFPKALGDCVFSEKNPEDVEEFSGDDAYDGGRYGLMACHEIINGTFIEQHNDKFYEWLNRERKTGDEQTAFAIQLMLLKQNEERNNDTDGFGRATGRNQRDSEHDDSDDYVFEPYEGYKKGTVPLDELDPTRWRDF